jgi:uncharacterized protein (DUF362 family)
MSTVYWSQTVNRRAFVHSALEPIKAQIDGAQTFLVKPNVVSSEPCPTTTHPETLQAVLDFLSGKDVVVADAPAVDAGSAQRVMASSPLHAVCEASGVPFLNLYKSQDRKFVSPRGYGLTLFTLPLERDLVISLPVLKSHNVCGMTGALKNQFGYLPRRERIAMHVGVKDIHKGIAELAVVAKPHWFIVDAVQSSICAQEMRHGGSVQDLGYMLAGSDPVALDCFGLKLLREVAPELQHKSPEDILHLDYALEYGVGSVDYESVEITV